VNQNNSKIVYLIIGLGSGGAEMMLYRLLGRIDREKYWPVVITLFDFKGPLKEMIKNLGVPVKSVAVRSRYDVLALPRLYKLIKMEKPDILHTQLYAADILGRIIGRFLKVPVIVTSIRNSYYGGRIRELLFKSTEKYADVTTIVSSNAAEGFISRGVIKREKLKVVYSGLDGSLFYRITDRKEKKALRKKMKIPESGFLWVAVGNLTRQKGYSILIDAFNLLPSENISLAIAGSGPLTPFLNKKIIELGLHDKIIIMGRVDYIPDLMAAADALVQSSIFEGLPGVLLEGMASALPVVAAAVGGVPEIVVDSITGLLVPPEDPIKLKEAMSRLMEMPEAKRLEMGQAGRLRVEEKFSLDNMVTAYENIYDQCLQEKG
jgi:glycosyltransferase involved in cell wall biosynthesis